MKKLLVLALLFLSAFTKAQNKTDSSEIYTMVEEMPEYPNGMMAMSKFIQDNIKIPDEVIKGKVQGKVFVKFAVFEDGSVRKVEIIKGLAGCDACSTQAMNAIKKMPRWKPGTMAGKAVKCYYTLPINFKP